MVVGIAFRHTLDDARRPLATPQTKGQREGQAHRAKADLELRPDFTFTDEEYNTYACPWHHNITTAVASFRTAKALKTNAGSRFAIQSFHWHNSTAFAWGSQQLMDLGLLEPGQWF